MVEQWEQLNDIVKVAAVLGGALLLYLVFRLVLLRPLERMAKATTNDLDDRLLAFAKRFGGLVLLFLAVLAVLKIFDVEISPLLAGAGIAGIALGLAAKETLADVLAGVFLIADRPMRIGDRIKVEYIGKHWGAWGDVVDIGLRRTTVRNTDGVIVNYPNNVLANSVITNFSFEPTPKRVRVRFQVGYDADLDAARRAAIDAIASTEGVLPDTAQIVVRSLWDDSRGHLLSGVLMEGRYRIADVRDRTRIRSAVLQSLHGALRAAGIPSASIPLLGAPGGSEQS